MLQKPAGSLQMLWRTEIFLVKCERSNALRNSPHSDTHSLLQAMEVNCSLLLSATDRHHCSPCGVSTSFKGSLLWKVISRTTEQLNACVVSASAFRAHLHLVTPTCVWQEIWIKSSIETPEQRHKKENILSRGKTVTKLNHTPITSYSTPVPGSTGTWVMM